MSKTESTLRNYALKSVRVIEMGVLIAGQKSDEDKSLWWPVIRYEARTTKVVRA